MPSINSVTVSGADINIGVPHTVMVLTQPNTDKILQRKSCRTFASHDLTFVLTNLFSPLQFPAHFEKDLVLSHRAIRFIGVHGDKVIESSVSAGGWAIGVATMARPKATSSPTAAFHTHLVQKHL